MISQKDVQHIAKLARIELSEKEIVKFQKEFASILEYFDMLKEVDVKNVEPVALGFISKNVTRKDLAKPKPLNAAKELLDMAPETQDGYVKVKSMFK